MKHGSFVRPIEIPFVFSEARPSRRMARLGLFGAMLTLGLAFPACVPVTDTPADNSNSNSPSGGGDDVDNSLTNRPPTARAGDDISASAGQVVRLDATASTDPDNDRLLFVWSQVDGDPTIEFESSPFAAVAAFTAPADITSPTTFTFTVAVLDGFSAAFDEVTVTVNPAE